MNQKKEDGPGLNEEDIATLHTLGALMVALVFTGREPVEEMLKETPKETLEQLVIAACHALEEAKAEIQEMQDKIWSMIQ